MEGKVLPLTDSELEYANDFIQNNWEGWEMAPRLLATIRDLQERLDAAEGRATELQEAIDGMYADICEHHMREGTVINRMGMWVTREGATDSQEQVKE